MAKTPDLFVLLSRQENAKFYYGEIFLTIYLDALLNEDDVAFRNIWELYFRL